VEQLFIVQLFLFCYYFDLRCTVGVAGLREGGDVRGSPRAAIMILEL